MISFRIDWFDLFAVQGTLKNFLQHHSAKTSILQGSAFLGSSLVTQMVKNLPAMWETQVQSLDQKDPLEKEWLPTLVLLLGEFHGQRNLVYYCPWGREELDTTEQLTLSLARDRETQKELFKRPTSVTDTESPCHRMQGASSLETICGMPSGNEGKWSSHGPTDVFGAHMHCIPSSRFIVTWVEYLKMGEPERTNTSPPFTEHLLGGASISRA